MAKKETSIKWVKNNFRCFMAGYCDLQYIFRVTDPQFYNAGVYGWNCNIYVNYRKDIAITTGYRNMTGKCIPDELIKKYSEIGKEIAEKCRAERKSWDEQSALYAENEENFWNELSRI